MIHEVLDISKEVVYERKFFQEEEKNISDSIILAQKIQEDNLI